MQKEILDRSETPNLRVYAVWLPFLGASRQAADVSQRVLPDSRVLHYWDSEAVISKWFAENVEHVSAKAWWDVYYLYGSDAEWTDAPEPLIDSGGTIIVSGDELKEGITTQLQDSLP